MTIHITFTNGTDATYTNCTNVVLAGGVYEFDGTNSAGIAVHVKVNWANVASVEEYAG